MTLNIPFGKPSFSDEEIDAVARVMRSGWIGMGPETLAFEDELAAHLGAGQVVTTNSCTSALQLSLLALGVGPGDEVICPSLTWRSTVNAVLQVGAQPVFCDVDAGTFNASVDTVMAALGPRTRVVMPVHFGGLAVDVPALRQVLPPRVTVIEDAAHALGARFDNGRPVGSLGHPTCFSFYANKVLSTGEGGAVALDDPALAARLRSLRLQGQHTDAWKRFSEPNSALPPPGIDELGLKANYTDLQAAIGRVQLRRQTAFAATRARTAALYLDVLGSSGLGLQFQAGLLDAAHTRHLFTLLLPVPWQALRDPLLWQLRAQGIGASLHYTPLHCMPRYQAYAQGRDLRQTASVAARIITLPIGACVGHDDALRVADAFQATLRQLTAAFQPSASTRA